MTKPADEVSSKLCKPATGLPLPDDLQYHIFALLNFKTRALCHIVCQSWNKLLRAPTAPVWGVVNVRTDDAQQPTVQTAATFWNAHAPAFR